MDATSDVDLHFIASSISMDGTARVSPLELVRRLHDKVMLEPRG